ncbi:UNVERIFIED_CONTAM: Transcription factor, partial [Sesamum radiatum]
MNAGIPPPQPLQFETTMPVPWTGLSCPPEQSFLDPNSSMDHHYSNFESALSSMVSSPATTTTAPFLDQMNMPNLGTSLPPAPPPLPALSSDPGFAERAAKFSCFGSRSFNGRTSPFGVNNAELGHRSNTTLMGNGKLPRVSSSPALKQGGSPLENKNSGQPGMEIKLVNGLVSGSEKKLSKLSGSGASSNEESSVSEQIPSGENGPKTLNEMSSRKRKAISRAKSKENGPNSAKVRREKISERMKLLQDLVPGCNKFLSMKLASVNPGLDFNMDNLLSKDFPAFSEDDLHSIVHMGFVNFP